MDESRGRQPLLQASEDVNRVSAISSTLGSTTTAMDEITEKEIQFETSEDSNDVTANHSPTKRNFSPKPESLDLKTATEMGCSTEHMLPCKSSIDSSEDLEKGVAAPVLLHAMPPRRVPHGSDLPYNSTWTVSIPPNEMPKLPYKRERRIWRRMRHNLLAVYQRLFTIVFIGNMIAFIIILVASRNANPSGPPLSNVATAAAANIMGAILIRQEYVVNALYSICCWTPLSVPLRIRRSIAKLYHFGGVHSGCAISAVVWFLLYTVLITRDFVSGVFVDRAVIGITYALILLFLSICVFAIPRFRFLSHNVFEAVHRFAGWIAVALFWVDIMLVSNAQSKAPGSDSMGILLVRSPAFWFLVVITFFIILPWLRLRKVEAFPEVLSNHAVRIHFKYMQIGPVMGIRITHNPMNEWHAFATIPEADGSSFSLIVSDAGDWTKKQILEPSTSYWVRGIPVSGVLRMAAVFKRVVIVATGSGIGPCLSMLVSHPIPARILWSTPNPLQTYGDNIVQAVVKADPQAMIINTRAFGRPDMVALTYHLYLESKAEAVFIISNPSLTRKVVYGMESRGIPAYGPIWDS